MTHLRTRMLADLEAKNLPTPVRKRFIEEVAALALHYGLSPDLLKPWQVRRYLEECAARMIGDKVTALEFFYTETLGWDWEADKMQPKPPTLRNPWPLDNPVRKRMQEDLRLRNYATKTQVEYDRWVGKFAIFHQASPETLGMNEVRDYLVHLVEVEKKAVGSCSIVSAALKFFYASTLQRDWALKYIPVPRQREKPLPVIPSQQEMVQFIAAAPGLRERVTTMICYGAGLRPNEVAHLKLTDIDSQRMVIRVERGKGSKDRYVMLSPRLLKELRLYWKAARPEVWLFPGPDPSKPTTAISVLAAVRRTGKASGLSKTITPRVLRHAFSTHLLENGMRLEQIQVLLGHRSIRSTQIYARLATSTVCSGKSPLDLLPTL